MILENVKCGEGEALNLFHQMQQEGVLPNPLTFVGVLNACASVLALEEGRCAHKQIIGIDFVSNALVRSSLFDMYAKCGSMEEAWRDAIPWCSLLKHLA